MHYEINVSKDGVHFFATHARSLTNEEQAKEAYEVFKRKFPASEGYELRVTKWDNVGRHPDWSKS